MNLRIRVPRWIIYRVSKDGIDFRSWAQRLLLAPSLLFWPERWSAFIEIKVNAGAEIPLDSWVTAPEREGKR